VRIRADHNTVHRAIPLSLKTPIMAPSVSEEGNATSSRADP